jgi:hypothetical protein
MLEQCFDSSHPCFNGRRLVSSATEFPDRPIFVESAARSPRTLSFLLVCFLPPLLPVSRDHSPVAIGWFYGDAAVYQCTNMAETVQVTLDGMSVQKPYTDEHLLRSLCEHDFTLREMAEACECDATTVLHYLRRYGLTTGNEQAGAPSSASVPFGTRRDGYEYWKTGRRHVLVHRLVAVAEWGFDAVADRIVHHDSVPWDNRPSQLQLFDSPREHGRFHARPTMTDDQLTLPESLPTVDQTNSSPARPAVTPPSSQSDGQATLDEFGVFG